MNWDDAVKVGNGLSYGGATVWRLPTINELQSLTIKDKAGYASEFIFRPKSGVAGQYWSSLPVVSDSGSAWTVDFSDGRGDYFRTYFHSKSYDHYVRLVRTSQ